MCRRNCRKQTTLYNLLSGDILCVGRYLCGHSARGARKGGLVLGGHYLPDSISATKEIRYCAAKYSEIMAAVRQYEAVFVYRSRAWNSRRRRIFGYRRLARKLGRAAEWRCGRGGGRGSSGKAGEGLAGVGVVSRARTAHLRDAVVERPSGQDTTECRLRTYKLRTRTSLSPVRAPGL